jgi:hypothetical protein
MTQTDLALLDNVRRRGGVNFAHVSPQYRDRLRRWAGMKPALVSIDNNRATITAAGLAALVHLATKGPMQ